MSELHFRPPMTLARVQARVGSVLPVAAVLFTLLAIGAAFEALPWDQYLTDTIVDSRTATIETIARRVSWFGSTPVVFTVAGLAALASWRRCPRLAIAIVVIALARPLAEWTLKELVGRERPAGDQLVPGRGPSFPSGHPLATAASWGLVPLVVTLYTARRKVWWAVAIAVWTLAVLVAVSRVWLGVHWTSDVVGGLLLAVLGVSWAEWFISTVHTGRPCRAAEPSVPVNA